MNKHKIVKSLSIIALISLISSCSTTNNLQIPNNTQNINSFSKSKIKNASDLLKKTLNSFSNMKDFTGTVVLWDSKNGNPNDASVGETKFFFKKKRNERIEVTKTSDKRTQGAIMTYNGGKKVELLLKKGIPFLGKRFSLKVTDKKLATSRGVTLDQLDMVAMLDRFQKSGVNISLGSDSVVDGKKTFSLIGTGTFKNIDRGVTKEVLSIDKETLLPIQTEAFIKDKTVLKITIKNLKQDVGLDDNLFVLPKLATDN